MNEVAKKFAEEISGRKRGLELSLEDVTYALENNLIVILMDGDGYIEVISDVFANTELPYPYKYPNNVVGYLYINDKRAFFLTQREPTTQYLTIELKKGKYFEFIPPNNNDFYQFDCIGDDGSLYCKGLVFSNLHV